MAAFQQWQVLGYLDRVKYVVKTPKIATKRKSHKQQISKTIKKGDVILKKNSRLLFTIMVLTAASFLSSFTQASPTTVVSLIPENTRTNQNEFHQNIEIISEDLFKETKSRSIEKTFELQAITDKANLYARNRNTRSFQTIDVSQLRTPSDLGQGTIQGQIICSKTKDVSKACPNLAKLPTNLKNLSNFEPGDFVIIPVLGNFVIPISPKTLNMINHSEGSYSSLDQYGADNYYSTSVIGHLFIEGNIKIAVIRTKSGARVIYGIGRGFTLSKSVTSSASSILSATFVPFSNLEKLLNLNSYPKLSGIINTPGKIRRLLSNYTTPWNILENLKGIELQPPKHDIRHFGDVSQRLPKDIQAFLNSYPIEKIKTDVNATRVAISRLDQFIQKNISNPYRNTLKQIRQHAQRTLNFNSSINVTGSFAKNLSIVKDVTFDLRKKVAKDAFIHSVSGLAKLAMISTSEQKIIDHVFDLSILDDSSKKPDNTGVYLNQLGYEDLTNTNFGITVSAFSKNIQRDITDTRKKIIVHREDHSTVLDLRIKTISEKSNIQYLTSSVKKIGYINDISNSGNNLIYLHANKKFGISKTEKTKATLSDILNITGSIGLDIGIQHNFPRESDNLMGYNIKLGIKQQALRTLLDPRLVDLKTMWQAFGNVTSDFNNQFGLPFQDFGIFNGTNSYEDIHKYYGAMYKQKVDLSTIIGSCDKIKKIFGNQWCRWFANNFSLELLKLQLSSANTDSLQTFIYSQATKTHFTNTTKTDFIIRIIMEILHLTNQLTHENFSDYFFIHYYPITSEDRDLIESNEFLIGDTKFLKIK